MTTTTNGAPTAPVDAVPLACLPDAIPASERHAHFELMTRLITTQARERRALPDGYAYRFDAAAFDDLAQWISNERRCCPFLTFAIEVTPNGGPVWVRLTGPAGTREFLDVELPPLP